MTITFIYNSNLLESNAQIIAHQCNCITKTSKGLSLQISKKFPYADPYSKRNKHSKPGTIKVYGKKSLGQRYVLSMFGQYHPGKVTNSPKKTPHNFETSKQRKMWFKQCLDAISSKVNGLKSIAFPCRVGCGLAGDWGDYLSILKKWSKENLGIKITIISLDSPPTSHINYLTLRSIKKNVETSIYNLNPQQKSIILDHLLKVMRTDIIEEVIKNDLLSKVESNKLNSKDQNSDSESSNSKLPKRSSWKNTTLTDYTIENVPNGWEEFFKEYVLFDKKGKNISKLEILLGNDSKHANIFPGIFDVYHAFEYFEPQNTCVIIIGQDPYHTPGAANGLAFSHGRGFGKTKSGKVKIQPSLRNIYKALEYDNFKANFKSGNLEPWAQQGVFLVNTALTVLQGKAGSHSQPSKTKEGPWTFFTKALFEYLNNICDHLVVVMWGNKAQWYKDYFNTKKHHLIISKHPAASVYNPKDQTFLQHKPFSETNKWLKKWKKKTIDWNLK